MELNGRIKQTLGGFVELIVCLGLVWFSGLFRYAMFNEVPKSLYSLNPCFVGLVVSIHVKRR